MSKERVNTFASIAWPWKKINQKIISPMTEEILFLDFYIHIGKWMSTEHVAKTRRPVLSLMFVLKDY